MISSIPNKKLAISHFVLSAVFSLYLFGVVLPANAEQAGAEGKSATGTAVEKNKEYIRQLEKRIADLEAVVNKLLDDKKAGTEIPTEDARPATKVAEDKKEELPGSAATEGGAPEDDDEWGEEPEIEKTATGRDEDARRRITELETWERKEKAKQAKKKEEESKKTKFALSGKYKLHYNIRDNLNLDNPTQKWQYDTENYFDQRFMLKMEATYDPMSAVFVLDKGNFVFDWKEDSEGTLERWGQLLTVEPEFVRELYLQYTGPFRVKAGRQNIVDPNGGVVLEGPGDGLMLTSPTWNTSAGKFSTSLAYLALAGGYRNYTDFRDSGGPPSGDRNAIFPADNRLDGFYLTFNYRPTQWLDFEPWAILVNDRGSFGDSDFNLDKDFDIHTLPRDGDFEPIYVGGALKLNEGRLSSQADFIWIGGSHDEERDINAYAGLLSVDYTVSDKFSIGVEGARGSGDKIGDSATDDVDTFFGLWLCKDRRKYANIYSEDLRAGYFFWDSSLANVTFVKAKLGFNPLDKLNMELAGLRLWTTEKVFKGRGPIPGTYDWSAGTSTTTETTRDMGWEIDFNINYQLFERLKVYTEFGYFIPGDVYQQADGDSADPATEFIIGTEFVF